MGRRAAAATLPATSSQVNAMGAPDSYLARRVVEALPGDLKSWRFASEHERARYAPLAGKDRHRWPWWAWHPDHGRRQRLGSVIVRQVLTVYAQRGADLRDLLRRHSDDWCQRVARACRLGPPESLAFALGTHSPIQRRLRQCASLASTCPRSPRRASNLSPSGAKPLPPEYPARTPACAAGSAADPEAAG